MIAIVPTKSQKDRIDTYFYHHSFANLDEKLNQASDEIIPAEKISLMITDGTHQTPTYTEKDKGVLFLSSMNISENGIDLSECKYITEDLHRRLTSCHPQSGDVLIAKSGTVGVSCVFPEEFPECSVYESVAIFRPNEEWNPNYISAFINSDLGSRQIKRSQKGIAIKHLHLGDLKELIFPKIDKDEQNTLVSRLNRITSLHVSLVVQCDKLQKKEHRLVRNKIDNVFADELNISKFRTSKRELCFLRDSNFAERLDVVANHPDYLRLVDQIRDSHLSGTLSDLVEIYEAQFNKNDHLGEEFNYLAIGDIDGISSEIIEPQILLSEKLPSRARRLIKEGVILIGIAGASTGTEKMVVFPVKSNQNGWLATTGFLVLRPKKGVDIRYVCNLLKAPFVLRQIRSLLVSPSMPTISEVDVMAVVVPVTDPDLREQAVKAIETVLSDKKQLENHLNNILEQINNLLLGIKLNVFELLDDKKYSKISKQIARIELTMDRFEKAL